MSTDAPVDDVVRLLEEDHRLVERRLDELSSADASTRGELFWKLTNDLVRHEVAEEIVVYPALRQLPGGDQVADSRIAEQSEAEEQLAKMEKIDAQSPEFALELATLKSAVLEHAKAEEESAFMMLVGAVPADQRAELGQRYVKAKDAAPTHPHPHAPDTPPGNVVLGPVAALVDRVRDAAASV
ncbi:MAG TPA: hemerythrin domain-containing protein [Acidimicrobiales bacterium]|nr:hemerythrin domain-containing protein [Acidimicrobiales bacterium]